MSKVIRIRTTRRWIDRVQLQLGRFRALKNNWDGEGSLAPTQSAINCAIYWVAEMAKFSFVPVPYVTPTDGGVLLSWSTARRDMELIVDPDGKVHYSFVEVHSEVEMEDALPYICFDGTTDAAYARFFGFLQEMSIEPA
jgi:hypothetical protein